jgi:hypothetical protein
LANVLDTHRGQISELLRNPFERVSLLTGATISNLRNSSDGGVGCGVLGFVAAPSGAVDWGALHIVSNHHVLLANGAKRQDPIFLLADANDRSRSMSAEPQRIARIDNPGCETDWLFAYPGQGERSYFVDCASASLDPELPLHFARTAPAFGAIARIHPSDVKPWRGLRVRMLGRSGRGAGEVVAIDTDVISASGEIRRNAMVIRTRAPVDDALPFARQGDSGALVVDAAGRAVGQLWGINIEKPHEAYASPIHPVLDALGLVACPYAVGIDWGAEAA